MILPCRIVELLRKERRRTNDYIPLDLNLVRLKEIQ